MPFYKTPQGQVFAYDTLADRQQYGAPDLVELTEAEVAALTAPPPPAVPSPAEQIEALERQTLLPRPVRDFMLISMEIQAAGQGISQAELRERNPGYRKVKELDEQIAALRALL